MPVRDRIVFFKDGQEFLPGGHVVKAGGGFRYIAEPMIMNL
jgi:hypothetical protein